MIRILACIWMCLALTLSNAGAAKTAGKAKPDSQPAAKPPVEAMVVLEGKPLFPIKAALYSFSPADRAGAVSARLAKLLQDPKFRVESIEAVNGDTTTDIVAGDKVLMSVTDADAAASGRSRTELAQDYAQLMRSTIGVRVKEYSAHSIAMGAAYAVAATIVLIILFILLNRLLPRFLVLVESWKGRYIRSLRLQSIELLHQDRIVAFIAITARTVRLIVVLLLINFYVTLVMSFFPWTREYSSKYLDYIFNPLKNVGSAIVSYVPKIFFIIVICVITHFVIKFTRFIFSAIENRTITIRGFYPDWAAPTFNIVRFLIIVVAAVAAFPYLPGSESPAFKGISVFLGVLISLGSSSAISNIIAGVIITYTRAFKLGDRIQIGDTTGDVVESNLLVTRIRTIKNVDITVPNSMVLGTHVINFSSSAKEYGLILHTTVTIGYDAPWRKVHELLIAAASSTEGILEMPAPFVLQTSLDDFYVSYQINAYTDKPSIMARTYSELHRNIQEKFNEAGVEIMSPHYAQVRDGNRTTIPEQYLPRDYEPGGIRVMRTDREADHPTARVVQSGKAVDDL